MILHRNDPSTLLALLSATSPISGRVLAQQLGISRAAVWKQIEGLRASGIIIHAQAGAGYRLAWPLPLLDTQKIRAGLSAEMQQRVGSLHVHWQLDSTNAELLRQAPRNTGDLLICLAETQTAGRGRRGRVWISPFSGNIYFSLLKRFEQGIAALSGLSLAVGVAVLRALVDCQVDGARLKWPNDVLVAGRKLAGVLVELGGEFLGPCYAIIGIGINWRIDNKVQSMLIDQPWIDLAQICGDALPDRNRLVARLSVRLIEVLDTFALSGFAGLREEYARYDSLRNCAVTIKSAHGQREGIALGSDERGALCVRHEEQVVCYDSAEVTVRKV